MRKASLKRYFIIMVVQTVAANFAHPVTPTLIQNLNFHSYMFGVAFAAMSLSYFLFAPLLGKLSDSIGRTKILGICCIGYAFGQFLMGNMNTEFDMMVARFVAGFFIGGIGVTQLTYVIDLSDDASRGKNLIYGASLQSVFGPIGYLIGGLIGTYSIPLLFVLQVFLLALVGILIIVFLKDVEKEREAISVSALVKKANPFTPFIEARKFITPLLMLFFVGVTLASLAATAYDQCFNYYIKDIYNFLPAYNGMLKAAIGFIALITNVTISMYLTKRTNIRKSIIGIFALASIATMLVALTSNLLWFIVINLIYYGLNAIYVPMQQNLTSQQTTSENSGQVMGFYSSMNSLGMVMGSLFAGFIYNTGASISFAFASVCFMICSFIAFILYKKIRKGCNDEKSVTTTQTV